MLTFGRVPSRIYSWGDSRPLAGARVAIKDLYDMKGLQTSGGSQAYALVTPVANETAPCIQQIVSALGLVASHNMLTIQFRLISEACSLANSSLRNLLQVQILGTGKMSITHGIHVVMDT